MRGATELISWDNGIKQNKLWLHRVWSLPEVLFLCQSTPHWGWLFGLQSSTCLIIHAGGNGGCTESCWTQDRGMGTTHNEGKTPCPGNSDSAVQSLLCYLPRAISSHKIFHSVTRPEKALRTPKVLESYNNPWSTPSSTKGAQQCSRWPARDTLQAAYSVFKESGKNHRGWFRCLHGHLALLWNTGTNIFGTPVKFHCAGMRCCKTIWSFQIVFRYPFISVIENWIWVPVLGGKRFCH